jgi:signal transduction histidine kinase
LIDALENIIRNSLEAIEESGTVTLSSRTVVKESQEWVTIEIQDTGRGISPEDLPRIFELFFTTKPGGMGFALWRAKTLVESLGGTIEASSDLGKGATFTISLPVA